MFLTCKLLKLDPSSETRSKLLEILLKSRKGYTYDKWEALDESFDLNFYIYFVTEYDYGRIIQLYYEKLISLHQISKKITEEDEESFGFTQINQKVALGPFFLSLFEKEPLENFVGILAGNKVSTEISTILSKEVSKRLDKQVYPLKPIKILIEKKQKEIRNIPDFYDVVEILVENIPDPYVDWAWIKGTMLDQSEEYYKFVESPQRGVLKVLAIRFRNRTYYLYDDGRIFTKEADLSSDVKRQVELRYIFEITRRLNNVGALI
ncbi:MAG: hypothetical protein QXO15_03670 [Nitrososphaerota archaeon]